MRTCSRPMCVWLLFIILQYLSSCLTAPWREPDSAGGGGDSRLAASPGGDIFAWNIKAAIVSSY
jgi:hypothetical protein